MNQDAWIKAAQALTMLLTAVGIQVVEADVVSIVTAAFGVLSILSAFKAFLSKEKQPTPKQLVEVDYLNQMIKTEKAKEKVYLARVAK